MPNGQKCGFFDLPSITITLSESKREACEIMPELPIRPEYSEVYKILSRAFGERASRVFSPQNVAHTMHAVKTAFRNTLKAADAEELGFHMADWGTDAAFVVALHLFPERLTAAEIRKATCSLALHVSYHAAGIAQALHLSDVVPQPERSKKTKRRTRKSRRVSVR